MAHVLAYERAHGREPVDVSGDYAGTHSFDVRSRGPGGLRFIEVKGTVSGNVFLSETEHRTAAKLGDSYYLYIVSDPLQHPRLRIVRDPARHLQPDQRLHQGVRYLYHAATWLAASTEG